MQPRLASTLAQALNFDVNTTRLESVSGGCIAQAYCLADGRQKAFIKCLPADQSDILNAEADGLELIAKTQTVATPRIRGRGQNDQLAWLALEWLDLQPLSDDGCATLGEQLAAMHDFQADQFGLGHDNFIGRTAQLNHPDTDWTRFFFAERMGAQLRLLNQNDPSHDWEQYLPVLRQRWQQRFDGYRPQPSLLHGDLWGGNAAQTGPENPVLFDPAVHYGDRECDLAMADLFGGFSHSLFTAYHQSWPPEPGWQQRRLYYQLYHLLNHANLFAGHYLLTCRRLMDDVLNH